jgi:uncharacterized protein YdaT
MIKKTNVVPNKTKGGWDIIQSGSQRSSGHFATKQEAIDRARTISQNLNTKLIIHNIDGKKSQ